MAEHITQDTQSDANANAGGAADVNGAGSGATQDTLSLQELNQFLGKEFKDKATALKSLKDTQSWVGKKVEASQPTPVQSRQDDAIVSELKSIKTDLFYSKNPQYEPYKGVISKMGENPVDVVGTAEFKSIFEDLTIAQKTKNARTVLESNPRIGQVRNKLTEAKNLASDAKRDYATADKLAVESVMDLIGEMESK